MDSNNLKRTYFLMVLTIMVSWCIRGQNVALHKPYTLSEKPNYKFSAPANDTTSLTDGKLTKGYFWTHKTTVGWQRKNRIKITINLEEKQGINRISLKSAVNESAMVYFPHHIYLFLSNDGQHYQLVGDAINEVTNPSGYKTKVFTLKNINRKAQYVTLLIIPNGKYFFTDEIQILKNKHGSKPLEQNKAYTFSQLDNTIDFIENHPTTKKPVFVDFSKKKKTANKKGKHRRQNLAKKELAQKLNDKFEVSFVVTKLSPWSTLSNYFIPQKNKSNLKYDFSILKNFHKYGAFVITNSSKEKQEIKIDCDPQKKSIFSIDLFTVPFIYTRTGVKTPDPLLPLYHTVKLAPGESKMVLFKIKGINRGKEVAQLTVQNKNKSVSITIKAKIEPALPTPTQKLNTNVWAYLNYPFLRQQKKTIGTDLENHHINTVVLNWSSLPSVGRNDFEQIITYLKNFKGIDNVLLYYNFKKQANRKIGKYSFLSGPWKNTFKNWYDALTSAIHAKYSQDVKIYFYPYDEISKSEDIEDFKRMLKWSKHNAPAIKYFATINNQPAMNALSGLVDILQIKPRIEVQRDNNSEIWTYIVANHARSLKSYHYRLMAWKAFDKNIEGIGFWNYADSRKGKSIRLDEALTHASKTDFSAIYFDKQRDVISSRRWEAFSRGIEDYKVIKAYARYFGRSKALELTKQVLKKKNNPNLADSVLKKMLNRIHRINN